MKRVQGQTLAQWMIDHPRSPLEAVCTIAGKLARGLHALHRALHALQSRRVGALWAVQPAISAEAMSCPAMHSNAHASAE